MRPWVGIRSRPRDERHNHQLACGSVRGRRADPPGGVRRPGDLHPAVEAAQRLHRHRGDLPLLLPQPGRLRRIFRPRPPGASARRGRGASSGREQPDRRQGGGGPTSRPRRSAYERPVDQPGGPAGHGRCPPRGRAGPPAGRRHRQPRRDHVPDGHVHRVADPHLLDGLHARRPAVPAVLRLPLAVLLLDARPESPRRTSS